ncbi:MAG: hypothetical protein JO372_20415, partial [Solirubrobacterales bacterium]|nr:hypothetical protein [Solirubrobacterales bacterium]
LNTTLRLVGRPDELRKRLFSVALEVSVRGSLADPGSLSGDLPGSRKG